ncbi:MAG TPA: MBL fold metallo-hydrolase [Caulobacter sp.]|nr:MBL fold metallo-hydrolase [Caulobacter sp.]
MLQATRRMLMLGAGASLLGPAARAAEPTLEDDGYFETWEELVTGVAVIRQAKPFHLQPIGNVTVIQQTDGLVLVDSGGSPGSGRRIVKLIRAHRPNTPVKAVILTHWHGDHPLGLGEILKAWPDARTIATQATKAHLADPRTMNTPGAADAKANAAMVAKYGGFADYCAEMAAKATVDAERTGWAAGARLFRQYAKDMDGALTQAPKEAFTDRLVIPDGTWGNVEARFLGRANTDGDAVVWLPSQRIMITGDILVAPIPYGYGGYPSDWLRVLKAIRGFGAEVLVPGHGAPMRNDRHLLRVGAAIESVRDQTLRLAGQGLDQKAVRAGLKMDVHARVFTGEDPWLRRWFDSYFVDPLAVSAFKEAKGEPIVQSLG